MLGADDLQIIKQYFIVNNLEIEGISIIDDLIKSKAQKDEHKLSNMKYAVLMPTPIGYLTSKYAGSEVDLLNRITLHAQINGKLPKKLLNEARKIIPKLMRPQCFYNDAIVMLGIEGINFKDDRKKYTENDLQNKKWFLENKE